MSDNIEQWIHVVKAHLPPAAELILIDKPSAHPAIHTVHLTGGTSPEIIAVYRLNQELYLLVLQLINGKWEQVATVKGPGYGVTLLTAAPIVQPDQNNLLVGWQVGSIWSKLSVYTLTPNGLRDIAPDNLYYSHIEVEDMPGPTGKSGTADIALWIHDTGEAYRVVVIKWHDNAFVPAPEVYSYYFPRVVHYYERLTELHPDYPFYWYYLADAQYHAGMPQSALISVRKALNFHSSYPSREVLLDLERKIKQMLEEQKDMSRRSVGLFPASLKTASGQRWGYIDAKGEMILQPRFDDARDFQKNGLAIVSEKGKYGVIDASGRYVVQPIYDSINPFKDRRAIVIDHEGFKMIDEQGNVLTPKAYSFIADLEDRRAVFYVSHDNKSKYGYLDEKGNEAIPAQFDEAGDFDDGKAVVKVKDKEYALIDPNGRRLATYSFAFVGPRGDGLLAFQQDTAGKYGYIDQRGNIVIPPTFTMALPFHDGRAIVNTAEDYKSSYGVINQKGEFVIPAGYNDIRDLGEERFALGNAIDPEQPFIGSNFAIADWNGKRLSDFLYTNIENFNEGLASASDATQTYFIDRTGRPASGYPRVEGRGTLSLERKNFIKAYIDRRLSYIDREGHVIWRQNTVIPLQSPYAVREEKYKPNANYLVYYPQVEGMSGAEAQRIVNEKLKDMSQVKPIPADKKLDYTYDGDFDVTFYKGDLLQLQLTGYNYPIGAAHGMPTMTYAIINLTNGHMYALKDLFKPDSDYVNELSRIIGQQIKEDPQYSYVFPGSYTGIKPDQPFFVSEDALHIYFAPYEIGPYAAGFPTFTIPFASIMSLINTEGEFWKSFH
ncbi:WG repeat-containing protein [Paenibacillus guangzhouensis]|uniref:WG repeat-containing protein n=1 Tax=Paenibacillus guangzhouensis TaxID=1473112 RepID=UPI001266B0B7|nr:WG repeat-containing protein [Paenibacillus guangzhouensis]